MHTFFVFQPCILSVTGKDSARYLQSRLTNDIKGLRVGFGCLAAALSPQGKTQALFSVYRISLEEFLLVADGGNPETIIQGLLQFRVADRIEVLDLSPNKTLLHIFEEGGKDIFPEITTIPQEEFAFVQKGETILTRRTRGGMSGTDLLISSQESPIVISQLQDERFIALTEEAYTLRRIQGFQPEFPTELHDGYLFWESQLLKAVSFNKGCYVGQEVIAKLDAYGKPPKMLYQVRLHELSEITVGTPVTTVEGDRIGKVVNSARNKENSETLLFASLDSETSSSTPLLIQNIPGVVL